MVPVLLLLYAQTVPGRFLDRLRGEGRLDQPAPGDLVSVWYSPYAVSRSRSTGNGTGGVAHTESGDGD